MRWIDRAGRRVSLRHLHIFMAVADCGSIAKAAALLSISHPVVSKTISDLEHVLGVKLLERGPRGVEPTVYGRACLDCGLAVFDELRRGLQNIQNLTEPFAGELRVGAAEPMRDLLSCDCRASYAEVPTDYHQSHNGGGEAAARHAARPASRCSLFAPDRIE